MKSLLKSGKRGRPKGRSNDNRSYGPLGDLIRRHRLEKGMGLSDVAKACQCSVQFVSNIEHGRAPLPWEKVPVLSSVLKIRVEELQAANLSVRSDFKTFVTSSRGKRSSSGTASTLAFAVRDAQLREVLERYQTASLESRKKFVQTAIELFDRA